MGIVIFNIWRGDKQHDPMVRMRGTRRTGYEQNYINISCLVASVYTGLNQIPEKPEIYENA